MKSQWWWGGGVVLLALVLMNQTGGPVHLPPGVMVPDEPFQEEIASPVSFPFRGAQITPLAEFDLSAKVLSRRDYRFDHGAPLAPVDLALGWGLMSDQKVVDTLDISQDGRWFFWTGSAKSPPEEEVSRHSANMHLIPANQWVRSQLKKVRRGQVVHLTGKLVSVRGKDGMTWDSSLTRTDTGDGACEVIYVERFAITRSG
ncbi:MAG: hypothetical protein AAF191_15810 [Verrucomicrobiota bacterium]